MLRKSGSRSVRWLTLFMLLAMLSLTAAPLGATSGGASPDAPTGLTDQEGDGYVTLSWDAVPGADAYKVFRSYLSGGGYEKIADVTDTNYRDEKVANGRPYYYVVRAVANGMDSEDSAEVVAIPHHQISGLLLQWPPSITHTIAASQATETIYARVRVKYVTVQPGATDGLLMQIGYGAPGTLPGTWDTWQEMTYSKDYGWDDLKEWEEWMGQLWPDQVGRFTYLVRVSPTGGRDWYYGGFRAGVSHGGILNVVPSDDTSAPAAPANLRITGTTPSSISLAWDANSEPDLYGYELYRQPAVAGGSWEKVAAIPAGTETYVDHDVSTGTTYDYYLLAVDTSYNRSGQSNQVTATAEARIVQVTFDVTVPAFTPALDIVYLSGNQPELGPWNPNKWAMTQVDATHWTTTVEFLDGTALEYKYTRGSWDTVEWWEEIHDLINRHLQVDYGTDGVQVVDDTVPNWRDPLVVSTDPASGDANVSTTPALSAVFNRGIKAEDLDTDRFALLDVSGNPVPGTAAYDELTLTATFTPAAVLLANMPYTWTIGPGIRGDAGSSMQGQYVVTFMTTP